MIKRFFIFILKINVISLLVLSFSLISLFRAYLLPESYNNEKLTTGISEMTAKIVVQKAFSSSPTIKQSFTSEELEKEVQMVITPTAIKNLAISLLDQLENYYINPNLEISLAEFKNNLTPVVNKLAQEYASKLPVCKSLPPANEQLPSCRPNEVPAEKFGEQIFSTINTEMITPIPAGWSLAKGSNIFLDNFSVVLKNKNKIFILDIALCLFFFLFIGVLLYPIVYQIFHNFGEVLLLSGFSLLMIYLSNFLLFNKLNQLKQVPAEIISFIRLIFEPFFAEIYIFSLSFLTLGIICYITFFILRAKQKKENI